MTIGECNRNGYNSVDADRSRVLEHCTNKSTDGNRTQIGPCDADGSSHSVRTSRAL